LRPIQREIKVANGESIMAISSGTLVGASDIVAEYVPELAESLVSLSSLADQGNIFFGNKDKITVVKETSSIRSIVNDLERETKESNLITIEGHREGSLYYTNLLSIQNESKLSPSVQTGQVFSIRPHNGLHFQSHRDLVLYYHDLLGHIGFEALIQLVKRQSIQGMHPDLNEALVRKYFPHQCTMCAKGSMSRAPISKNRSRNKHVGNIGDSVEIDIMYGSKIKGLGSESCQAYSGYELVMVAVDRSSRFTIAYLLKNATDLHIAIDMLRKRFISDGHILRHLRFDDQFNTSAIRDYLQDQSITYDICPPYEHALLGLVERTNRTLEEKLIKVMSAPRIKDKRLWGLAVADCVLKINLSPRSALNFDNPYERWYKRKFDMIRHPILPFGVKVMAHIAPDDQRSLRPKSVETIAVGTPEDSIGCVQLLQPKTQKLWNRRTFRVVEDDPYSDLLPIVFDSENTTPLPMPLSRPPPRRSSRISNIRSSSGTALSILENKIISIKIPRSVIEARNDSNYGIQWMEAMRQEISSLFSQQTFEFIGTIPPRHQTIPSMFIFDIRYNPDGSIKKFKCRLVARGDRQHLSTFSDTFADTVSSRSINIILSLAAIFNLDLESIDIKTAFLYSPVKEDIYIKRPLGVDDDLMPPYMKLNKCLYGLKQAAHEWKSHIHNTITTIGFIQCKTDECVYVYRLSNMEFIILAIHVDDILVASSSEKLRLWFNQKLQDIYEISLNYPLDSYLGMSISRDRNARTISVSQPGYIDRMLESYQFDEDCDPDPITPMAVEHDFDLSINANVRDLTSDEQADYMSKVGAVQYLAVKTRPDLGYAISRCSMKMQQANLVDLKLLNRILRYLKHTKDLVITFGGSDDYKLRSFADASYGSHKDRKSHYGISLHLGSGGSIQTISKRTKLVALSSTEAEYIGLCEAAKVVAWARQFLEELGFKQDKPTIIYEDNQSAIAMVNNGNDHGRTKHIDIRYHYIRDLVKDGQVIVKYLRTEDMVADTLTKALEKKQFKKFRTNLLGVVS
jgi:hypothetical protein